MVVRIYPGQGNLLYAKALVIRRNEPSRTIRILCFFFLQSLRTIHIRYIVVWTRMRIIRVDSESTFFKQLRFAEWTLVFQGNP